MQLSKNQDLEVSLSKRTPVQKGPDSPAPQRQINNYTAVQLFILEDFMQKIGNYFKYPMCLVNVTHLRRPKLNDTIIFGTWFVNRYNPQYVGFCLNAYYCGCYGLNACKKAYVWRVCMFTKIFSIVHVRFNICYIRINLKKKRFWNLLPITGSLFLNYFNVHCFAKQKIPEATQ